MEGDTILTIVTLIVNSLIISVVRHALLAFNISVVFVLAMAVFGICI